MNRSKNLLALLALLIVAGAAPPSATSTAATYSPPALQVAASEQLPDRQETGDQAGAPTATIPTPVPPRPTVARPAQGKDLAVALPTRIKIPAVGIDAAFEFVGLTAEGAMDTPKDAQKAAWYELGPRPGEIGNAVVAGHVDWAGKAAVFWGLGKLKAGDLVEVSAADGRRHEFAVQWLRWYDTDRTPLEEVFGQATATEITLITCGGEFDHQTRQYLSRLVVRAVAR